MGGMGGGGEGGSRAKPGNQLVTPYMRNCVCHEFGYSERIFRISSLLLVFISNNVQTFMIDHLDGCLL